MSKTKPAKRRAATAFSFMVINTFALMVPLTPFALVKILVPLAAVREFCNKWLNAICTLWADNNGRIINLICKVEWDIRVDADLNMDSWYLVLSNHQSWADILALQYALNHRIPYFRFFLKKQLMWFPVLNFVWYALDYPVMERYSKSFLEKNPHLKGKDVETTRKSCERFRNTPVSIMNFVEGTRFSPEKREKQGSPFQRLLKPKSGGVALVLAAMGERLTAILDVTIAYPEGPKEFWDFLGGGVDRVTMRISSIPVTDDLIGDYDGDPAYRESFQNWINGLWSRKDKTLEEMLSERDKATAK